jgi:glycosyltransferase involved in cell wall biosynthesis
MKFSIVTPVLNGEKYIAETILSVITQKGNFDIEYILVDGGSKDKTSHIIKMYRDLIHENTFPIQCHSVHIHYIREKDNSMYEAINKGFSQSAGDIYAYINSDDTYLPGAFRNITYVFKRKNYNRGALEYYSANLYENYCSC